MKTKLLNLIILTIILASNMDIFAQNKYALLITGPDVLYGDNEIDPLAIWNNSDGELNEFWNDTYNLYNLLYDDFNYPYENTYVFYSGFQPTNLYPPEYLPFPTYSFKSGPAIFSHIVDTIQLLQSKITENDFLFVWVFSHGFLDEFGNGYFYIADNIKMMDTTLAKLLNPISCKKVIWMQQCSGGSFNEPLKMPNVIFTSAVQPGYIAHRADNNQLINGTHYELLEHPENEIFNYPYSINHGEFNFHMISSTAGRTPSGETTYGDQPVLLASADLNNDHIISVHEAAIWEATQQSHIDPNDLEPPLYDEGTIGLGDKTSLRYPNIVNSMADLNLNPGAVNTGIYGVTDDLVLSGDQTLSFGAKSKVYLLNNSKITLQDNAVLNVGDSVEFYGNEENSIIIDHGTLNLGLHILFSSRDKSNHIFDGLHINGYATVSSILHTRFHKARLWNAKPELQITMSEFDGVLDPENPYAIYSVASNITILQSTFDHSSVFVSNPDPKQNPDLMVQFQHNTMVNGGISIDGYRNYKIDYNQISSPGNYAIYMSYAGNGGSVNQSISQNNISNSQFGMFLNNSQARIYGNNIHNTQRGVYLGNYSTSTFLGCTTLAQTVRDCDIEELLIEHGCFPTTFKYNKIVDDDNFGCQLDPLLRYQGAPNQYEYYDITLNCWGSNFNPFQDLTVIGEDANVCFSIYPTWCPGNPTPVDPPIDLYNSAINAADSGNYFQAKSIFKLIVDLYPESLEAEASLKELFQIEELADNNYPDLQSYYMTNDSILADSILQKTAEYLAVRCNEKFENWSDEIAYFENIIINPDSEADSLFAIMDLAHTYLLMENSPAKSSYVGSMPGYRPASLNTYLPSRDTLILKFPGNEKGSLQYRLSKLQEGQLLQCIPNPADEQTTVFYKLTVNSEIQLVLADLNGRTVSTIFNGPAEAGIQKVTVGIDGVNPGIYLIKLKVNGKMTDLKKLTVL